MTVQFNDTEQQPISRLLVANRGEIARRVFTTARRLGVPLLAGSSVPLAWRIPTGTEWPLGESMDEIVVAGYGPTEIYGFHNLEAMQVFAERRAGGETGVTSIRALAGDDAVRAINDGTVNPDLLDRALSTFDLVPEDRCHLNGLAMVEGRPKYVTALGRTDAPGAWREGKATGGVVIDVETDEVVAEGLAMPHSPRWRDGRLWVLNSGAGELISIDPADGRSEVVCCLPGYLRGLALAGPFALVGMCKIREKHVFGGLPIQQRCSTLLCGVAVVDLRRGAEVARFEFTSGCEELYDVQFLPGIRRPTILNLEKHAARQAMTNAESSFWLRPSNEVRDEAAPAVSIAAAGNLFSFSPDGQSAGALEQTGKPLPDSGN